jgi:hypothetical protein
MTYICPCCEGETDKEIMVLHNILIFQGKRHFVEPHVLFIFKRLLVEPIGTREREARMSVYIHSLRKMIRDLNLPFCITTDRRAGLYIMRRLSRNV